jgi:hypothetical protein
MRRLAIGGTAPLGWTEPDSIRITVGQRGLLHGTRRPVTTRPILREHAGLVWEGSTTVVHTVVWRNSVV